MPCCPRAAWGGEPRYEQAMLGAEQALKQSSLSWTILRPNNFNQNFDEDFWLAPIQSGRLAFPIGDVTEPFIDSEDIAAVAATVLTEAGHESQTYDLSGPEELTFTQAAAEIAKASGRTVVLEDLSPEAFEQELADDDWPEDGIAEFSGFFTYLRTGKDSPVTNDVRRILGREPIRFADYVRKVQEAGGWD